MAEQSQHPRVRRERRDLKFRGVIILIAVAVLYAVGHLYAVRWLLRDRERELAVQNASRYPLADARQAILPKAPRLEQVQRLEANRGSDAYRAESAQQRLLASYGATSEEGFVHIPIDRAMDLVIAELPTRHASAQSDKDNGLLDAGESNSGRMFRGSPP